MEETNNTGKTYQNNYQRQNNGQNQQKPQGVPYRQLAEENEKLKVQNIQFAQVLQEICNHLGVPSVKDIPARIDVLNRYMSNNERIKFLMDFIDDTQDNKDVYPKQLVKDVVAEITWRLNVMKEPPVMPQQPEPEADTEEEDKPEAKE